MTPPHGSAPAVADPAGKIAASGWDGGLFHLPQRDAEGLGDPGQPYLGNAGAALPAGHLVAGDGLGAGQQAQQLRQLPLRLPRGPT